MSRSIWGLLVALAAGVAMPAGASSLIVNGSFESSSTAPGSFCAELVTGDTTITGWEVTGFNIHYCEQGYWPASDGARSIDLDGDAAGGIRQSFATTAGQTYSVTFDMAGNYYGLPAVKDMQVSADGQTAVFQFDTTGHDNNNFGWTAMTFSFVADDGSATLEFLSLTPTSYYGGYGAVIDNVVVTPEPGTLALLFAAVLGVGIRQRLRD